MDLQQTQQTLSEYKDKLVDTVNHTIEQAQQGVDHAKQRVADDVSAYKEQLLTTVNGILGDERVVQAQQMVAKEATTAAGYKDQLVGGVKETVGHLIGDQRMERAGRNQKREGLALVGSEAGPEDRATVTANLVNRHALMAEVERTGGVQRCSLNHVDVPETDVSDFLRRDEKAAEFKLKQWNKQPLLDDIRTMKTMKPLVHVEPCEKGLLRSLSLDEKDLAGLKNGASSSDRDAMWKEIKQTDLRNLHHVSGATINDRSGVRLDLLKSVSASQAKRDELLKQIENGHEGVELKHVETEDKARVETEDKCKPVIGDDVSVRTWNKEGFLAEVRQGTELKHI
jgi:uncharacterized protein YjbJ (UPF0337 family)